MNFVDIYIDYLKNEKKYTGNTIISYINDLKQFSNFVNIDLNSPETLNIKKEHIRNWVIYLFENKYSSTSINRKLSTLKSFFKYLLKRGFVKNNPVKLIATPKSEKKLPSFINIKQINELLDNIFDENNNFEKNRDRLIIEMFYLTGIRRNELINIKLGDIDFNNCKIKIIGKGNKERIIPISKEFSERIKRYLELKNELGLQTEYLFVTNGGQKLYPEFVYRVVKKYLTFVSTIRKRSPHVIRHTFATHLLNEGADLSAIKDLLGHSSLAATQVYTHNSFEKLKKIYKLTHPRS